MPPEDATISILDEGLVRGDGAFEVLKLYGGHPFRLARPRRPPRAAPPPRSISASIAQALEAEIAALLAAAAIPTAACGSSSPAAAAACSRSSRSPSRPPSARIALVELTPSEILAGVKSISYAANMQATRLAGARGADEAVYVRPDGIVLEAPTSSVFWVAADGSCGRRRSTVGILDSITRAVVVAALDVEEGDVRRSTTCSAPEAAFLASTDPRDPAGFGGRRRRARRPSASRPPRRAEALAAAVAERRARER